VGPRHQIRPMFHTHVSGNPYLNKPPDKYASATISKKATTIVSSTKSSNPAPTAPVQSKQERVTRFVPVAVKLRKRLPEERPGKQLPVQELPAPESNKAPDEGVDAYSAFMSEMEDLM